MENEIEVVTIPKPVLESYNEHIKDLEQLHANQRHTIVEMQQLCRDMYGKFAALCSLTNAMDVGELELRDRMQSLGLLEEE